jgi:hypothetical protein
MAITSALPICLLRAEPKHRSWQLMLGTRRAEGFSLAPLAAIGFCATLAADITGLNSGQPVAGAPIYKSLAQPFRVSFPEAARHDLSQPILATRWRQPRDDRRPHQCTAISNSTGRTPFIQVRSRHHGALPSIVTPGWRGSMFEHNKIIEPMTNGGAWRHGRGRL